MASRVFRGTIGGSNFMPANMLPDIPGYNLERKIATGGMSTVFLGRKLNLEQPLAIKVFDSASANPADVKRFLREARIMASLKHPHIVKTYDVGMLDDARIYLATEYLPGGDLEERRKKGMKENIALQLLIELATTLEYVHKQDLVHCDIKPANILFREDDSLVLADFGLATNYQGFRLKTRSDNILCTANYSSPEQVQGLPLDQRSDIYSLGIVFLEMLTNENPFADENSRQAMINQVKLPLPILQGRLARYQPLLERMLAKKPEDRFATMTECMICLDRIMAEATGLHPVITDDMISSHQA